MRISDWSSDVCSSDLKQDYKQTINLPETAFPMQAKLAEREPQTLARWLENDLYGEIQRATVGRPKFWFIDGPPYANGAIHIGHAAHKVLKAMIVTAEIGSALVGERVFQYV